MGSSSHPQIKLFATQYVPCSPTIFTIRETMSIYAMFLINDSRPDTPPVLANALIHEKDMRSFAKR